MKNTRIERLKQSKRVKQATKLLTVGLLVCPLAIGAIKALADETEATPPVEQVEEIPATTETSESVQPEVVEEMQAEEPTVIEDSSTEQQTIKTPVLMEQSQEDTKATQTSETYTYYIVSNIVDDNGNIIETRRSPETAVKDSTVEIKAINWYGYYLLPGTPSEYSAQITQDGTQEFVFTYMSATSEKHRDLVKDKQIDDLFTELYNLYEKLVPKAQGTEFEDQLQTIYYKFDDISHIQGIVKAEGGLLAWYEYSLPKLPAILDELKSLADEINATQPKESFKVGELDRVKAKEVLAQYNGLIKSDYTPESWAKMKEILDPKDSVGIVGSLEAICNFSDDHILTGSNKESVQQGIYDWTNTITEAMKVLVKVDNGETPLQQSIAKLKRTITSAESKLTESGYTEESMKALSQALQNAKDILASTNSTQTEIDEAQKALDLAIANLVKEDNSNGGNTGNNGSNGTGNGSNDPNTSNNGTNNTNNQTNNKQNSTTTTTKPAGNNTNKDGLPQTGEQSATNAVIAGLSITMLSILAWFKRKKA